MSEVLRKNCVIIANPASGKNHGRAIAKTFADSILELGATPQIHFTEGPKDARNLAQKLAGECDVLCAIGGDGTINEVISGRADAGSGAPITVIPAGTANVVWRELGLPKNFDELARIACCSTNIRTLDLGQVGQNYFAMCAGAGFDAKIVEEISRIRKGRKLSMLSYYWPTLKIAFASRHNSINVSVDNNESYECQFVIVGNMKNYGGPFSFFDNADPADGLLDVCCMNVASFFDLLKYSWGAWRKNISKMRGVKHFQGTSIKLTSDERVPLQLDGDSAGELPTEISLVPRAVSFCVVE